MNLKQTEEQKISKGGQKSKNPKKTKTKNPKKTVKAAIFPDAMLLILFFFR